MGSAAICAVASSMALTAPGRAPEPFAGGAKCMMPMFIDHQQCRKASMSEIRIRGWVHADDGSLARAQRGERRAGRGSPSVPSCASVLTVKSSSGCLSSSLRRYGSGLRSQTASESEKRTRQPVFRRGGCGTSAPLAAGRRRPLSSQGRHQLRGAQLACQPSIRWHRRVHVHHADKQAAHLELLHVVDPVDRELLLSIVAEGDDQRVVHCVLPSELGYAGALTEGVAGRLWRSGSHGVWSWWRRWRRGAG